MAKELTQTRARKTMAPSKTTTTATQLDKRCQGDRPAIKAGLIGGGIGSMTAAAFMIRDGGMAGKNVTILEASPILGGSLDGVGNADTGYSLRGGRMLTTDNYERMWDLLGTIPVPKGSKNVAFISRFVEIKDDVVFTVEYSVKAAQIAVYELLKISRPIPHVTPHDTSLNGQFDAQVKAFK